MSTPVILSVNINRCEDSSGQVYITINLPSPWGQVILRADRISVAVDGRLPDPFNMANQVTIWQDG